MRIVCVLLVALGLVGCKPEKTAGQRRADEINGMPSVQMETWPGAVDRPMRDKIAAAPQHLIAYLHADNDYQRFNNRPRAAVPTPELLATLRAAIDELPEAVRALTNARLVGIFLVHDLGGIGYTTAVRDANGERLAGLIVLDVDQFLKRTANDLFTWKENQPYRDEPSDITIWATIESPETDDVMHAVQFILLHELGHIASIGNPDVGWGDEGWWEMRKKAFTTISWSPQNHAESSYHDAYFELRSRIRYYGPPASKLPRDRVFEVYDDLLDTDFPSPYAATNAKDDFAESFALYVHVLMMDKPFVVGAIRDVKLAMIESCWHTERCEEKQKLLSKLLPL